jgi:D-xylose transport system substrate-binding protein
VKLFKKRTAIIVAVLGAGVFLALATGATARKSANIQVCVLLPDTKSSVRWEQFDRPAFAAALKKAKVTYSITNALNDAQKQRSQADQCLANGAKVVIVTSLDAGSSIAIEKAAAAKGAKSIDYDRQVVGGIASVYVSFDGHAVGMLQGRGVVTGLKKAGTFGSKPVVAELNGGSTDQNAFWFKSGYDDYLKSFFKKGTLKKGPDQFVPGWLATNAATIFEQMLTKTNNKINGVVAANDNMAGAVVATLKRHKLKPLPLTGQDATAQGVQNILAGWQTMTVYKQVPKEANAAAAAALALLHGKKPKANGSRPNGSKKEPTILIPPIYIDKSNYKLLFKEKFLKRSEVCVGVYKQYCK